jgi:hypothetical protein
MKLKPAVVAIMACAFAAALALPQRASAVASYIYDFEWIKNGVSVFLDSFDDGVPPAFPTYLVVGTFPAGSEADGRLRMDSAFGNVFFSPIANTNTTLLRAQLNTNIDPNNLDFGLKIDDTFSVSATFDVVDPVLPLSSATTLALNDFVQGVLNNLVIGVRNFGAGPMLALYYADQANALEIILGTVQADVTKQVQFRLSRNDLNTSEVVGEYRYVGDADFTVLGTGTIFTDTNFTRPEFRAFEVQQVPEPGTLALLGLILGGVLLGRNRLSS